MDLRASKRAVLGVLAMGAGLLGLAVLESARPLRARTTPRAQRWPTNIALGLSAGGQIALTTPLVQALAHRRLGLLSHLPAPRWLRGLLAFLLLDWTFYLWHRCNHEVGWLWVLHRPHHADPDLDVTTALRFHPLELLLSLAFRAGQVAAIGPEPGVLLAYDAAFLAENLFHHSASDLGSHDRALSWLLVTPRMHGVHHSARAHEARSNWGVVLSCWDRLHGSYRHEQSPPPIGLPDGPVVTALRSTLAMPLR